MYHQRFPECHSTQSGSTHTQYHIRSRISRSRVAQLTGKDYRRPAGPGIGPSRPFNHQRPGLAVTDNGQLNGISLPNEFANGVAGGQQALEFEFLNQPAAGDQEQPIPGQAILSPEATRVERRIIFLKIDRGLNERSVEVPVGQHLPSQLLGPHDQRHPARQERRNRGRHNGRHGGHPQAHQRTKEGLHRRRPFMPVNDVDLPPPSLLDQQFDHLRGRPAPAHRKQHVFQAQFVHRVHHRTGFGHHQNLMTQVTDAGPQFDGVELRPTDLHRMRIDKYTHWTHPPLAVFSARIVAIICPMRAGRAHVGIIAR